MSLFEDDDWIKKLLGDKEILEELGLHYDLDESEIQKIIEEIQSNPVLIELVQAIENEILHPEKFIEQDIPFDETKKPSTQFIEEALLYTGSAINSEDDLNSMQIGKKYSIIFPNKKIVVVRLENVVTNEMGTEYVFYNISGADDLIMLVKQVADYDQGMFPIPKEFLYSTIIREID